MGKVWLRSLVFELCERAEIGMLITNTLPYKAQLAGVEARICQLSQVAGNTIISYGTRVPVTGTAIHTPFTSANRDLDFCASLLIYFAMTSAESRGMM